MLLKNPPATWEKFCLHLFRGRQVSRVKTNIVFQILHYALSGGNEPTPLHIMVAEGIYSLTNGKECIISIAGDNRAPLPPVLEATSPLNGAMDNFDRNESTLAGTGSMHDTILVLFQNVPVDTEKPSKGSKISTRLPFSQDRNSVRLQSKVKCQKLIRMGPTKHKGEIDASAQDIFTPVTLNDEPSSSTLYESSKVSIEMRKKSNC